VATDFVAYKCTIKCNRSEEDIADVSESAEKIVFFFLSKFKHVYFRNRLRTTQQIDNSTAKQFFRYNLIKVELQLRDI
jgi:hypothetical protein